VKRWQRHSHPGRSVGRPNDSGLIRKSVRRPSDLQPGELSRMIDDGWSWTDISRAMFEAGIFYRTGRPIPEGTLCAKAYRARLRYRSRPEPEPPHGPSAPSPRLPRRSPIDGPRPPTPRLEPEPFVEEEKPVFRLITPREAYRPASRDEPAPEKMATSDVNRPTADEIYRRIFGDTAKS